VKGFIEESKKDSSPPKRRKYYYLDEVIIGFIAIACSAVLCCAEAYHHRANHFRIIISIIFYQFLSPNTILFTPSAFPFTWFRGKFFHQQNHSTFYCIKE